jgi:hypothetical protein
MRLRAKCTIEDLVADSGIDSVIQIPVRGKDQSIGGYRGWRSILRPFSRSLFWVAVSVFLWGLAYKLSLYYPQQESGVCTNVANVWAGPRPNLSAPRFEKSSERTTPGLQLILTDQRFPYSHAADYAPAIFAVDIRFRSLLTALGSPPAQSIEVRL